MPVRPILLLGDPLLWQRCLPVAGASLGEGPGAERQYLSRLLSDLRDTLIAFRRRHGTAKGIAAPQIGALSRVVYIYEPGPPRFLLNPVLQPLGTRTIETWESCMSFPGLYVRTLRSASCSVSYVGPGAVERSETADGELAIVLQHECDHLDGKLSLQRASGEHPLFLGGPGRIPPSLKPTLSS